MLAYLFGITTLQQYWTDLDKNLFKMISIAWSKLTANNSIVIFISPNPTFLQFVHIVLANPPGIVCGIVVRFRPILLKGNMRLPNTVNYEIL